MRRKLALSALAAAAGAALFVWTTAISGWLSARLDVPVPDTPTSSPGRRR
jgi:hypothetical protein